MSEQQSVISPPQNSEDMAVDANEEGLDVDFEGMVREEEALEQEEIPDQEEQARQGAVSGNNKDFTTIPKLSDLLKNAEGTATRAARAPKLTNAREIEDHEGPTVHHGVGATIASEASTRMNGISRSKENWPIPQWSECP